MNSTNLLWAYYVLSVIYCAWRVIRRYSHTSLDGVTGPTPGLDMIAIVALAPILAPADLIVTGINSLKKRA